MATERDGVIRLERYSNEAKQLVAGAQQLADDRQHGEVTPLHLMALGVSKRSTGFQLWHEYVLSPTAGKATWKSPYPVAIGVTQGTWHESADLYNQWNQRDGIYPLLSSTAKSLPDDILIKRGLLRCDGPFRP